MSDDDLTAWLLQQLEDQRGRAGWLRTLAHTMPPDAGAILREEAALLDADRTAKRAILDLHAPTSERMGLDETTWTYGDIDPACLTCGASDYARPWPCATVKLLARSHAGREGWREEWSID